MKVKDSILRNKELIIKVRENFLERYEENKEFYDEIDVQNIKNNDWSVWRFLRPEKYNPDSALEKLDKAMQWRKEFNINFRKESDIPKEFFEVGGMFPFNCDKDGISVIFLRIRVNLKIPKLNSYIKDFIAYIINKIDEQTNENGFVLVFDLTDAGIRNADLDLCSYLISLLRHYFPEALRYCLVYNFPWILRSFWPIVKMWIPAKNQDLVKFANKDEIKDYIDVHNLPKYLGGTCDKNFAAYPKGCKSVTELVDELGFSEKEIKEHLSIMEPNIIETRRILCNNI